MLIDILKYHFLNNKFTVKVWEYNNITVYKGNSYEFNIKCDNHNNCTIENLTVGGMEKFKSIDEFFSLKENVSLNNIE